MIKKAYIDTADGQMHYRYSGDFTKAPPLVFFHMTAASSGAYDGILEELDGKIPMIAPDTVNYGESYRTTKSPTMGYIANVMLEMLTNLGVERLHTFGHHTGVSVQVDMALRAPSRVLSVIANGPTYGNPDEMAYLLKTLAKPNPINDKGTQLIWAWTRIRDNFNASTWINTPHGVEILNRDTIDMLRAGENWHWAYQAVFTYDLVSAMKKLTCPLFLVCGGLDLAMPFHERAANDFPNSLAYVNPEAGTYFVESHPEDLGPRVLEFIKSVRV